MDYEDQNVCIGQCHELRKICHTLMQVVCKLIPTTPSGTVIAPLYGVIAPTHDFTKYNRERVSSELAVSMEL